MSVNFPLKIICVNVITICIIFGQDLELIGKSQKNAITMCKSGLLQGVDKFVFDCAVTLETKDSLPPAVNFNIKKRSPGSKYNRFLTINLRTDCDIGKVKGINEYNCTKTMDTKYLLTIHTKALMENSGATIRALINTEKGYSNEIQHPPVDEPTNANGTLKINGLDMSEERCILTIIDREPNVVFDCKSPAKPCKIEILKNGLVVKKGENHAEYRISRGNGNGEELNLTIKYAACRLDGEYKTINCSVNTTFTTTPNLEKNPVLIVVGVTSGFILLIASSGGMFLLYMKRKRPPPNEDGSPKDIKIDTVHDERKPLMDVNVVNESLKNEEKNSTMTPINPSELDISKTKN